jgi:hypothetical protein
VPEQRDTLFVLTSGSHRFLEEEVSGQECRNAHLRRRTTWIQPNVAYLVRTIIDITDRTFTNIFVAIPSLLLPSWAARLYDVSWYVQQYQAFTNLLASPPPSPTLDLC